MKALAMLPPAARRALARKELERRGMVVPLTSDAQDRRVALRFLTDAELERLHDIVEQYQRALDDEMPVEVRAEHEALCGAMLRRIRAGEHVHWAEQADGPLMTSDDRNQLAERLERQWEPVMG